MTRDQNELGSCFSDAIDVYSYYNQGNHLKRPVISSDFIPTELQKAVMTSLSNITIAGGGLGWGKTEVAIRILYSWIVPSASLCVVKKRQVDLMGAGSIGERLEEMFVNNRDGYSLICVLKPEWEEKVEQYKINVHDVEAQIEYCKANGISFESPEHPISVLKKVFASVNKSSPVTFNFKIIYIADVANERGEYRAKQGQEFYPVALSKLKHGPRYYVKELNGGLYSKRFILNAIKYNQDECRRLSQHKIAHKNDYFLHVKDAEALPIDLIEPVIYTASLQLRHLNDQSCGSSEQLKGREIDMFLVDELQEIDAGFFSDTVIQRARSSSGFKKRHPDVAPRIICTCNPDQNSFLFETLRSRILDEENHYLPRPETCGKDYVFTRYGEGYRLYDPVSEIDIEEIKHDADLMGVLNNKIENVHKLTKMSYINGSIDDNAHLSESYRLMIAQKDNPAERMRRMYGAWSANSASAKFSREIFGKFVIDSSEEFQRIDEKIDMFILAIDTAFKSHKHSDYTAYCLMGVSFFPDEDNANIPIEEKQPFRAYVYDIGRITDRHGLPQNDILALETFLRDKMFSELYFERLFSRPTKIKRYSNSDERSLIHNAGIVFIEGQNVGVALMQKLKMLIYGKTASAQPYFTCASLYPATAKLPRVVNTLSYYRRHCVFLPAVLKQVGDNKYAQRFDQKAEDFLREACAFGTEFSKNDDMIDAITFCLEYTVHILYRYSYNDGLRRRYAFFPDEEKNYRLTTTIFGG